MDELISKQELLNSFGLSEKTRKWGGDHSGYDTMMLYEIQDVIESQPPVRPQEPKIVPIAVFKFDDDMLHEIVEEAVKNIVVEYDFNGMTNGEVLKAIFPQLVEEAIDYDWIEEDWLNSPYEPQESEDKCKNCEYYRNPDYTRCHECEAERSDKE